MGSAEDEARTKAINLYRILALVQFCLGVGLLACGGFGTQYSDGDSFGPPYFLGGFLVGSMMVISALLSSCVAIKGAGVDGENVVKKQEVACAMMGQYILSMFTFMTCFMGLVFAGIAGCDTYSYHDDEDCSSEKDKIRYAIIAGCVLAILTSIFSLYIVCVYGTYFGVVMRRGRRGRMVMSIDPGYTNNTMTSGTTHINLGSAMNDARAQQLQRENALLQQQLQLQQQLNQQQQQQQQHGGSYPPPPPTNYGFSTDAAYPPTTSFPNPAVPPPPYSSIDNQNKY